MSVHYSTLRTSEVLAALTDTTHFRRAPVPSSDTVDLFEAVPWTLSANVDHQ